MKTQVANPTLADVLDQHTAVGAKALWWHEDERIRCVACGHRCLIGEGKRGICKVRYNDNNTLRVPFGYVAAVQCDPVEKKPFFHVYPSSDALTFGMMGCDLHCSYCQNWVTSQALRDAAAVAPIRVLGPAQLVETARREQARLVVSSYNEPLITAEWAVAVFKEAKQAGLACAFVSNGNATPEVLDFLRPWIIAYKVDLKSFNDQHYRSLGGMLANITSTIRMIHERGIWLEVVTLVIPGFNDSEAELRDMAQFLASVSRDIPWHITAFHKDYRMTDPEATSPRTLMRAAEIGAEAGLRYIYAGNLPGRVGPWENTRCPQCQTTLIERYGYLIRGYHLTEEGCCPRCQFALPGIWPTDLGDVRTGNDLAAYAKRLPRAVATACAKQSLPMIDSPSDFPSSLEGTEPMTMTAPTLPASRPRLTTEQQQRLLDTARALVRHLVVGQNSGTVALDGLGEQRVAGVFVSLKRGKHLRSCCGMLGQPIPLRTALQEAAQRTVWDDIRFPPISPAEIDHLDMEVWLLHSPEPVPLRGKDRLNAVTIGKHGIQVVRGQQHGLFLPSVALDQEWDREQFLHHVCIKAGLPPTAWKEDATTLFTFEGEMLRGPLADPHGGQVEGQSAAVCRLEDLRAYANLCRDNIHALLMGNTPSYYFFGAPDGNVNGVIVSLQPPQEKSDPVHFCQIFLRPGIPLQSTLFTLCQNAAQMLSQQRWSEASLSALKINVTVLYDPALHGSIADPELEGIDPRSRALMVVERKNSAVVFDAARQPAELLAEAARRMHVAQPEQAAVFSLAVVAAAPLIFSTAPQPVRGPSVRPPAVAGSFYPADATQLARQMESLFTGERRPEAWPAAMVPHAGLVYSGRLAARVLQRLQIPQTVIILGPKHTALGMDWAVAPHQTWTFPGGQLASDVELAQQLADSIPGLELDALAHQREHGIEVELPLLAHLAPQTRVVGIAIGAGDLASCQRFAEGLTGVLKQREDRPLLLISSDMNHFANDAETRRLDELALQAMEQLDPAELYRTVTENHISMCGLLPAVIVLETLRLLDGLHAAERVGYATSADVSGDKSRVVGYAGMLIR